MSSEAPEPLTPSRSRLRATVGKVAVDVTPLRVSRDFRRLWSGLLVSELGYQFTVVATYIQVYKLTKSAAALGLTGLVGFAGLVVGTLAAGSFLDAYDRRKVLIGAQLGFMLATGTLFVGALAGRPPIGVVYAAIALIAGMTAIDSPTRSAITPRLIGLELLPSALALNQVIWNGAGLVGPALAGLVIGHLGLEWAYGINVATFLVMLAAAMAIRPVPPEIDEHTKTGWAAVREGFAYLRGRRVLQSTFGIDIIAMVFGMPRALFTILAVTQFHRGAAVAGFMFAAPAVGAFVAALTAGWVGRGRTPVAGLCFEHHERVSYVSRGSLERALAQARA